MKLIRMIFTGAVVAVAAACSRDTGAIPSPLPPLAAIRYFNAIPDTGAINFRLVDNRIEWSPSLVSATFRGFSVYQALGIGDRTLAIFHDDTLPQYAIQEHARTTIAAVDDARYTVVYAGFLRTAGTPPDAPLVFTDNPPTPAAGRVGVRLIHAGAGLTNVDLYVHRVSQAPGTALQTNVAFGEASGYFEVDTSLTATDSLVIRARQTGTATDIATIRMSIGVLGTTSADPNPGSRVEGSVFTYVLTPRSVAGSQATQSMTTPALTELLDRRPAPTRTFP